MAKSNLQIRLPEEIRFEIEKVASGSKSSFVREAIEEKLRRERDSRLEKQWIRALEKHPEESREAEDWLKAERWESS